MVNEEVELIKKNLLNSVNDSLKTIQVLLDTCHEEMQDCIKLLKAMNIDVEEPNND